MSFEILISKRGTAAQSNLKKTGAGIAVHEQASTGVKSIGITVYLDLAKKLRWIKGDRVQLSIGTGDSEGMIKMQRVKEGGLSVSNGGGNGKHSLCVQRTFGKYDQWLLGNKFSRVNCDSEIDEDGSLIIFLPSILKLTKKP
jgi:hypothetical protein